MSNLDAACRVVAWMREHGRVEEIDEARVQHFLTLAGAVDDKPFSPGLHQEYRAAIEGLTSHDDSDSSVDELLDELRGS